ncbi:MAG TPA: serine hydrolase domain-containing protein [bacterium]|nr:serine hydrolase domain-containing protein [bacterium]
MERQVQHRLTPTTIADFERRMASALVEWPTPGLQAAVLVDGDVVWTHAAGVARFDPTEPLTTEHLHRIGSITKLFTAHAILILHDEGKLHIDDPVSKWLPEFRPSGPTVTLRHILCHGSEIPAEGGRNVWESGIFPDEAEFRRMIATFQPVAAPMMHLKYSNAAFSMLGLVVEAAAGGAYEAFVLDRIVRPLGMGATRFHLTGDAGQPFAQGHFIPPLERRFEPTPHQELRAYSACGMLLSTPTDVLALAKAQWAPPSLLSPGVAAEARRVHLIDPEVPGWKVGYGLGWRQLRRGERVYIGHSGSYLGNRCALEISCEDRVAAAVFSTVGGSDAPIELAMDFVDAVRTAQARAAGSLGADTVPADLRPLLGHYAMHRWYEATIGYDGRQLVFSSGLDARAGVPLAPIAPGRLRILAGRAVGEDLVVNERASDGTVLEFSFGGSRMRRL